MAGAEACFAPVFQVDEAPRHPTNTACGTFVEIDGRVQPTPAPLFSRTPPGLPAKLPRAGERTVTALLEWSRRVSAQSSTLITGFLLRPVRARISGRSVKCRDGWLIRRCFSPSCAGLRRDASSDTDGGVGALPITERDSLRKSESRQSRPSTWTWPDFGGRDRARPPIEVDRSVGSSRSWWQSACLSGHGNAGRRE